MDLPYESLDFDFETIQKFNKNGEQPADEKEGKERRSKYY
jgi:hypothetical protein